MPADKTHGDVVRRTTTATVDDLLQQMSKLPGLPIEGDDPHRPETEADAMSYRPQSAQEQHDEVLEDLQRAKELRPMAMPLDQESSLFVMTPEQHAKMVEQTRQEFLSAGGQKSSHRRTKD